MKAMIASFLVLASVSVFGMEEAGSTALPGFAAPRGGLTLQQAMILGRRFRRAADKGWFTIDRATGNVIFQAEMPQHANSVLDVDHLLENDWIIEK